MKLDRDGGRDDFGSSALPVSLRRDFARGRADTFGLRPDLSAWFFIADQVPPRESPRSIAQATSAISAANASKKPGSDYKHLISRSATSDGPEDRRESPFDFRYGAK
jgi:hypothetical protein